MKKLNLYICCVLLVFGSLSCEDQLDEKFLNPDRSTETKIEYLFTQALLDGSLRLDYGTSITLGFGMISALNDMSASPSRNGVSEISDPTRGERIWRSYYENRMARISEMRLVYDGLTDIEKRDYEVYLAIGNILDVFETHKITDIFGDMPYSEAFLGRKTGDDQILFPKFDSQESIYQAMFLKLDEAIAGLFSFRNNGSIAHRALATQDLVFFGDLAKWIKFANSLRLRLAIRISDVDASKAQEEIDKVVQVGALVETNEDNVLFQSTGPDGLNGTGEDYQLSSRAFDEAIRGNSGYASITMIDFMNAHGDPRRELMFTRTVDSTFVGIPNAPDLRLDWVAENGSIRSDSVSTLNRQLYVLNDAFPGVAFTAAETAFLKAEAISKGLMGGEMVDAYAEGIRLSIEFYSDLLTASLGGTILLDEMTVNTFLEQMTADFNGTLEEVWMQKWIHLSNLFPLESWAEYRRTNTPDIGDYLFNGRVLARPNRLLYSTREVSFNPDNYAQVADQDEFYTKLWWDVR